MGNVQQAVIDDPDTISPASVPRGQVNPPPPAQTQSGSGTSSYQVPDPFMQAQPPAPAPVQLDASPTYRAHTPPLQGFYASDLTTIGAREAWAPEIEQETQQARWQGMSDYRNERLGIQEQSQQRQSEALTQREKDRQDALDAKAQKNKQIQDFEEKGIQYDKATGEALKDQQGNPMFKPISENDAKKNGVQYDDDQGSQTGMPGRGYLVTRDTQGNLKPIDPDRDVKPETWTDDSGAPWLVKKNKYNAWDYIDPTQAINDPKMQQPAAKALWSAASAKADNDLASSKSLVDESKQALDPDKLGINEKVLAAPAENQLMALMPTLKTAQATLDPGPPKPRPPGFFGFGGGTVDQDQQDAYNQAKQQVSMLAPYLQNLQDYIAAKNQTKGLKEGGANAFLQDYLQKKKSPVGDQNLVGEQPQATGAQAPIPDQNSAVQPNSPSNPHPDDATPGKFSLAEQTLGALTNSYKRGQADLKFSTDNDAPTRQALLEKQFQAGGDQDQGPDTYLSQPFKFIGGLASDWKHTAIGALEGAGAGLLGGPFAEVSSPGGALVGGRAALGIDEGLKAKAETTAETYNRLRQQGVDQHTAFQRAELTGTLSGAGAFAVNAFMPGGKGLGTGLKYAASKVATGSAGFAAANAVTTGLTGAAQRQAGVQFNPGEQTKAVLDAARQGAEMSVVMEGAHALVGQYGQHVIAKDVDANGANAKFVQRTASQFAALDASKLSPEKVAQAKAAILQPLNSAIRPIVEDHINTVLDASNQISQSQAAATSHFPPANPKFANMTDAQLAARAGANSHPDDPLQTNTQDVQAEIQRRSAVRDALAKNAPVVDAIVAQANRRSEMTKAVGRTAEGKALLDGVNRANAARTAGTPKIDLDTAQLASDLSPKVDPDANIQPHTLGYVPMAHDIESIPDPKDRDFAQTALKVLNGREIDPTAEKALAGSEGKATSPNDLPVHHGASGMPLARRDDKGNLVLTDEGLDKVRQLVPSARGMLQKDGMPVTSQHLAENQGKVDEKAQPKAEKALKPQKGGQNVPHGTTVRRVPHLAGIEDNQLAGHLQNLQKGRERLQESIDAQTKRTGSAPAGLTGHVVAYDRNIAEHEQEIEARRQQRQPPKSDVSPSDRYWTATGDRGTEVQVPAENHPDRASAATALRAKLKLGELLHDTDVYPPESHAETPPTSSTPETSTVRPTEGGKAMEPISAEQKPAQPSEETPEQIAYHEHGMKHATVLDVKKAAIKLTTSLDNLNLGRGLVGNRLIKIVPTTDAKTMLQSRIDHDGTIAVQINHQRVMEEAENFRRKKHGGDPQRWIADAMDEELKHVSELLASREKWEAQGKEGSANDFWQKERRDNLAEIKQTIADGNKAVARAFVQSFHNYANVGKGISDEDFAKKTGDVSDGKVLETAGNLIEHLESSKGNLDVTSVSEFIRQMLQAKNDGTLTESGYRAVVGKLLAWMKSVYDNLQEAAHGSPELAHILKPIEDLLKVAENSDEKVFKPESEEERVSREGAEKEQKEALPQTLMQHAKEIARDIGIKPGDYDAQELKEGLNKGHLLGLLRKNGMSVDQFRQALNARGFNFETPNDAVQALVHKPDMVPDTQPGGLRAGQGTSAPRSPNDIRTDREVALSPEQLREEYKAGVAQIKSSLWDFQQKGKMLKRAGMEFSAKMRFATGDLTGIEATNKRKFEASNYRGKPVSFEGKEATVIGPVFGKTRIKFADGSTKLVENDKIEHESQVIRAGSNRYEGFDPEREGFKEDRGVYFDPKIKDQSPLAQKNIGHLADAIRESDYPNQRLKIQNESQLGAMFRSNPKTHPDTIGINALHVNFDQDLAPFKDKLKAAASEEYWHNVHGLAAREMGVSWPELMQKVYQEMTPQSRLETANEYAGGHFQSQIPLIRDGSVGPQLRQDIAAEYARKLSQVREEGLTTENVMHPHRNVPWSQQTHGLIQDKPELISGAPVLSQLLKITHAIDQKYRINLNEEENRSKGNGGQVDHPPSKPSQRSEPDNQRAPESGGASSEGLRGPRSGYGTLDAGSAKESGLKAGSNKIDIPSKEIALKIYNKLTEIKSEKPLSVHQSTMLEAAERKLGQTFIEGGEGGKAAESKSVRPSVNFGKPETGIKHELTAQQDLLSEKKGGQQSLFAGSNILRYSPDYDEGRGSPDEQELTRGAREGSPGAAADLLGRVLGTSETEFSDYDQRARQAKAYVQIARQVGKILPPDYLKGAKFEGAGSEHAVFTKPSVPGRVFKATKDSEEHDYGAGIRKDFRTTPYSYLSRLSLSNSVLGDDIKWEGVIPKGDHNVTITSQSKYAGEKPSEGEIAAKLKAIGFEPHHVNSGRTLQQDYRVWYRPADGVVLGDAEPRNFIKTSDGVVRAVDVIPSKATPELKRRFGLPESTGLKAGSNEGPEKTETQKLKQTLVKADKIENSNEHIASDLAKYPDAASVTKSLRAGSNDIDPDDYEKLLSELQQGMPSQSDIDALREKALAEKPGEQTIGQPRKANPAAPSQERRTFDAVQHMHAGALEQERQTQEQWNNEAYKRLESDPQEAKAKALRQALNPEKYGNPTAVDVKTMAILTPQLMQEAYRTGDEKLKREAATLAWGHFQAGANQGRAFAARFDPFKTPRQRNLEYLTKMMTIPDADEIEKINKAANPAERNSLLAKAQNERLKKLEGALAQMGIKPEDIFAGEARVSLKSAKFVQDAIGKATDARTKQAMRLFLDKAPMEVVRQQTGLSKEEVIAARQTFDADILAKVEAMVRGRGFKAADFEKLDPAALKAGTSAEPRVAGARMTKLEEDAEIAKVMEMIRGDYKDVDAGKYVKVRKTGPRSKIADQAEHDKRQPFDWKKFDASNKEQVIQAARLMQAADGNGFNIFHEVWQSGLLSGPQTHVAISIGQGSNAIHEFIFKRPIEAALNAFFYKDPKSAQVGELKHLYAGIMPGIARAWEQSIQTFRSENDTTRDSMLNAQMEINPGEFEGGSHIGYIPGKAGKIIRLPFRVISALDSFNKTLAGMMAVGAEAYRSGKGLGLEAGELSKYIDNEIKTPGSDAWQKAYDIAANQIGFHAELPEVIQKFSQARNLKNGKNFIDKMGRLALSMTFPFIKVPYNLTRIGLRKSPLGALNAAGHITNGLYKMAEGKPFIEGYSKAQQISDMAEQFMAWGATALLAGAVEGDPDDDKKSLLITAPRYYGVNKSGDVSALDRKFGGPTMIRVGGRNGVYINYGKFEPIATVLGALATGVRGFKAGPQNFLPTMIGGLAGQIKANSFFQGMSTIIDTMEAAGKVGTQGSSALDGLGAKWTQHFIQSLVPNIFRQPIRNWDDAVRDGKFGGPSYVMTQNPAFANQLNNLYGEPETKTGIAPLRVLFQSGITPSPTLEVGDKFLTNYNQMADKAYWPDRPTTAQYSLLDRAGKKVEMTANQATAFDKIAGQLFKQKINGWLTPTVAEHPTEEFKERFTEDLAAARKEAKQRIQSTSLLH